MFDQRAISIKVTLHIALRRMSALCNEQRELKS